MRVIAGSLGGRRFNPPGNMPYTRPTTDIAKEGLFNIIQNNLELDQVRSLDLFGGTGSISYELFSRGVDNLTIVEKDTVMYEFIKKMTGEFGMQRVRVVKSDVFKFIHDCTEQYNLIFAGPPYALDNIEDLPLMIFKNDLLVEDGWFILEHTPRNDFKSFPFFRTERKYGTTLFSIFVNRKDKKEGE
jgi:16S rRNA (guanine(966)-N(2))-methyltransferase RsmD